jgi:pyruvate/2-oxoacid:ferredoxin oxidoreductase alpha subunit
MQQARVLADSKNVAVLETLSRKCKTHVEKLTRENKKIGHVSMRVIFIFAKKQIRNCLSKC